MSKRGASDTGAATSPGPSKVQKIIAERGGGSDVSSAAPYAVLASLCWRCPLMPWSGVWNVGC